MKGTGRPGFGDLHLLDPVDREPFLRTLSRGCETTQLDDGRWLAESGLGHLSSLRLAVVGKACTGQENQCTLG